MISTILSSATIVLIPLFGVLPTLGNCGWAYAWAYDKETSTIYLCYSANETSTEFTKYHELGHHFWYKYMNQSQRDEYTKLWKESKDFYRDYGKTSAMEDFADTFSIVTTNKNILRIRQKTNFIKSLLK